MTTDSVTPSERAMEAAREIASAVIGEFAGAMLVPDGYSHEMFYGKRMADVIQPHVDRSLKLERKEQRERDVKLCITHQKNNEASSDMINNIVRADEDFILALAIRNQKEGNSNE